MGLPNPGIELSRARVGHIGFRLALAGAAGLLGVFACAADGSAPGLLASVRRAADAPPAAARIHVVQSGDTVWFIGGGRSGCVRAILAASEIQDARRIRPGDELTVPVAACPPAPAHVAASVQIVAKAQIAEPPDSDRTRGVPGGGRLPTQPSMTVAVSGVLPDVATPPRELAPLSEPDRPPDALLDAEAHLRAARFEEALTEARKAMRMMGSRARDADVLRALLVVATVHVALADRPAARESLGRALEIDPALALDPAVTSPKVLEILAAERARREIRVARRSQR